MVAFLEVGDEHFTVLDRADDPVERLRLRPAVLPGDQVHVHAYKQRAALVE